MKIILSLLALLWASSALALEFSCQTQLTCVTPAGCAEKLAPVRIAYLDGDRLRLSVGETSDTLTRLPSTAGTRVLAYGAGQRGHGLLSLTVFDNLTFTYTSHLKLKLHEGQGIPRGVNVTVLGTCELGNG